MATHHGKTRHRKVPKPVIEQEPPLVANCVCCHCQAVFQPHDVEGSYLGRTCPKCGKVLREESYDERAASILEEKQVLQAKINKVESECDKWIKRASHFKWKIFSPLRRALERKAEAPRAEAEKLKKTARQLKTQMKVLALSRYYAGEWFQRTHIPLVKTVVNPYTLQTSYSADGGWHLYANDKRAFGVSAEIAVFDKLMQRVADTKSELFHAQVVPNVYLPHLQRGRGTESHWDQIDCLVLTRKAAFVIEVKGRRRHIVANEGFQDVYSTSMAEIAGALADGASPQALKDESVMTGEAVDIVDENRSLAQNSRHAVSFADLCDAYPFERVYEQLVFVATKSFFSPTTRFEDNVNVSVCDGDRNRADNESCRSFDFVDAIESALSSLDSILTQKRVDELGEQILATYGDLNQKREHVHAQRIESLSGEYWHAR